MPVTLSQLQKELGCSKGTVRNRLVRMAIGPDAEIPRNGSDEYMAALDSIAKKVDGDNKHTRAVSRDVAEALLAEYAKGDPEPEYVADEQPHAIALSKRDIAEAVAGGVGGALNELSDKVDGIAAKLDERDEQIKEAEERGRRRGFVEGFNDGARFEFREIKVMSGFRERSKYLNGGGIDQGPIDEYLRAKGYTA